jgi:hypothetical protein
VNVRQIYLGVLLALLTVIGLGILALVLLYLVDAS